MTGSNRYGITRQSDGGDITSPWLTAEEAALYCGWETPWRIRKAVQDGDLTAQGVGQQVFHVNDLDAWLVGGSGGASNEQSEGDQRPPKAPAPDRGARPDNEKLDRDEFGKRLQRAIDQTSE